MQVAEILSDLTSLRACVRLQPPGLPHRSFRWMDVLTTLTNPFYVGP